MANTKTEQAEIDGLREELRRLRHAHEASEKELAALRSGKHEARTISESADFFAAERDALKAQNAELAAYAGDLATVLRYYESSSAPPSDVMQRVNTRRYGTTLQNGVPPQAVKS